MSHETSDAHFEELAKTNPSKLMRLISDGSLPSHRLTYAAEILGRGVQSGEVTTILLGLLHHVHPSVREGAILGLDGQVFDERMVTALTVLEGTDPSPGVRTVAKGHLLAWLKERDSPLPWNYEDHALATGGRFVEPAVVIRETFAPDPAVVAQAKASVMRTLSTTTQCEYVGYRGNGCTTLATCFGSYDGDRPQYRCDEHCGHCQDDGMCTPHRSDSPTTMPCARCGDAIPYRADDNDPREKAMDCCRACDEAVLKQCWDDERAKVASLTERLRSAAAKSPPPDIDGDMSALILGGSFGCRADVIAIEKLEGFAYGTKGGGVVSGLVASSAIAGGIAWLAHELGIRCVEISASRWRGMIVGRPNATDAMVKVAIMRLIPSFPSRSNCHERDAAGCGLAAAWSLGGERRAS